MALNRTEGRSPGRPSGATFPASRPNLSRDRARSRPSAPSGAAAAPGPLLDRAPQRPARGPSPSPLRAPSRVGPRRAWARVGRASRASRAAGLRSAPGRCHRARARAWPLASHGRWPWPARSRRAARPPPAVDSQGRPPSWSGRVQSRAGLAPFRGDGRIHSPAVRSRAALAPGGVPPRRWSPEEPASARGARPGQRRARAARWPGRPRAAGAPATGEARRSPPGRPRPRRPPAPQQARPWRRWRCQRTPTAAPRPAARPPPAEPPPMPTAPSTLDFSPRRGHDRQGRGEHPPLVAHLFAIAPTGRTLAQVHVARGFAAASRRSRFASCSWISTHGVSRARRRSISAPRARNTSAFTSGHLTAEHRGDLGVGHIA